MTRPLCLLLAVVMLLGLGATASVAAKSNFTAVQAQGREYRISLSRAKIKQGTLRLEFANFGEDDHDLAIRRKGNRYVRNVGRTAPGKRNVLRFKARKGTYTLWCTLSDHKAKGMQTKLKVTR